MNRSALILTFVVWILINLIILDFSLDTSAQTNQPAPISIPAICVDHGGVNCTTINPDALAVCNDGVIEESTFIYAVPECHKTLEDTANQESDFMARNSCYPPSEMGCFSEQSYQNLHKILTTSGLANSELGKNELAQCRQQITAYALKERDYRQCLFDSGQTQFNLSGKAGLPILKAVFCSIFYGDKSSYNSDIDLCLCNTGYFIHNDQCVQADKICQDKYGPRASAKNGNCVMPSVASAFIKSLISPKAGQPKDNPKLLGVPLTTPELDTIYPAQTPLLPEIITSPSPTEISNNLGQEIEKSFVKNIVNSLISGLKKMLKLF